MGIKPRRAVCLSGATRVSLRGCVRCRHQTLARELHGFLRSAREGMQSGLVAEPLTRFPAVAAPGVLCSGRPFVGHRAAAACFVRRTGADSESSRWDDVPIGPERDHFSLQPFRRSVWHGPTLRYRSARALATPRPARQSMILDDLGQRIGTQLNAWAIQPVVRFFIGLDQRDRTVLCVLLVSAVALGFATGRRWTLHTSGRRAFGRWRVSSAQNSGEMLVSRVLLSTFRPPDYHLMNHVTLRMDDGTTQVDHILVSRFGVFVIETKDYRGWIFANAADDTWTQVLYRRRFKFQNPIFQNSRHVRAVRDLLAFLPPDTIRSVVVFSGDAEFKTAVPEGVTTIGQFAEYLGQHTKEVMSRDRLQFCVGRLETARLAITRQTDVEHVQSLVRRHGNGS